MSHNHKIGLVSPSASVTIIPVLGNNPPHGKTSSVSSILQPSLVTANNQNRKPSLSALNAGTSVNIMQTKALLQRNSELPDSTMSSSHAFVTSLSKGSDPSLLSAGRNTKRGSGTKSRGKNMTTSNPVPDLDLMGCTAGRKGSRSGIGGHPPPASVARRNARERNRVKQVNNGFAALRQHIPLQVLLSMASESGTSSPTSHGGKKNKISKVDTLRCAVEYIRSLEQILADTDPENTEPSSTASNSSPGIKSEWMSQCGSPNALNGGLLHSSEGLNVQHLYHGESSAEELIDTSSEFNEDNFGCDDENISPRSLARRIKVENNNDDPALYHHAFTFEDVNSDQHMHDRTSIEQQQAEYALQSPSAHPMTPTERKPHVLNSSPPSQHLFAPTQTLPSLTRAFPGKALNFMLQPQQEHSLLYHTKEKQNEDPNSSGELDPTGAGSYSSPESGNLLLDSWWPIPSM